MNKKELHKIFDAIDGMHVVVVGDVMLDNYWWGNVERISPEAPVPVVALTRRESRLGGAANVALNCRALGAKVTLASVVGDDSEGATLTNLAQDAGIDTSLIMKSWRRPTTTKIRVLSRNQQMLRLDDEITDDLFAEEEHPFIDLVLKYLQRVKPQVLIFEDYNKGLLKENVIQRITAHCKEIGIITAVDPKKKNFLAYKDVTIFKPNLKEVREGLNMPLEKTDEAELNKVHKKLHNTLHHETTFITLSEKGVFYNNGFTSAIIPSHIRNIADVSGAGDTVIATAALIYAITKDVSLMAEISNLAGGLVCEDVGVVSIKKDKLRKESELVLCLAGSKE
jgi:rfaE bifunctional protein kinase chain/domain